MVKLKLDPDIRPEFQTYFGNFEGDNGNTSVWLCKSNRCAGIEQSFVEEEEHIIMLSPEELLNLKSLIDQAVEMLEGGN